MTTTTTSVIFLDRSSPFNPAEFIGKGWTIEEEDERSLALNEVDPNNVSFETTLESGEQYVQGEERLHRLKKAGHIRLDAKVFQALWNNQHLIPESWKDETNGDTTYIHFHGTVMRSSDGDRCVLYLNWETAARRWRWYCYWLKDGCAASDPSAVLRS